MNCCVNVPSLLKCAIWLAKFGPVLVSSQFDVCWRFLPFCKRQHADSPVKYMAYNRCRVLVSLTRRKHSIFTNVTIVWSCCSGKHLDISSDAILVQITEALLWLHLQSSTLRHRSLRNVSSRVLQWKRIRTFNKHTHMAVNQNIQDIHADVHICVRNRNGDKMSINHFNCGRNLTQFTYQLLSL